MPSHSPGESSVMNACAKLFFELMGEKMAAHLPGRRKWQDVYLQTVFRKLMLFLCNMYNLRRRCAAAISNANRAKLNRKNTRRLLFPEVEPDTIAKISFALASQTVAHFKTSNMALTRSMEFLRSGNTRWPSPCLTPESRVSYILDWIPTFRAEMTS